MLYGILALIILTLSMFTVLPSVVADEWKIYKLSHGSQKFKIPYKIANGEIKTISGSVFAEITVNINSDPVNEGILDITVPRNLVDNYDGLASDLLVLIDGERMRGEREPKEVNNSPCFRTLSIKFSPGSKQIGIIGVTSQTAGSLTTVLPVYITTDKTNYEIGETISVLGCTNLTMDDEKISVEILDPRGKIYRTMSVTPNVDGSFSISTIIEGALAINGTYTAKATYAGKSATSSFVVPEFSLAQLLVFAASISIIIAIFARNKGLFIKNYK